MLLCGMRRSQKWREGEEGKARRMDVTEIGISDLYGMEAKEGAGIDWYWDFRRPEFL